MNIQTYAAIGALAFILSACAVPQSMSQSAPTQMNPTDGRTGGLGPFGNNPATDILIQERRRTK